MQMVPNAMLLILKWISSFVIKADLWTYSVGGFSLSEFQLKLLDRILCDESGF